jgi:hypothetical protein
MALLPKHNDIAQRDEFEINLNLKEFLDKEKIIFDSFIAENSLDSLLERYPIRQTPVLNAISSGLGLSKDKYESAVRKLIIDDVETRNFYKSKLSSLTSLTI